MAEMENKTDYEYLAHRFNEQMNLKGGSGVFTEESDAQHNVIVEEFEEYIEAYIENDKAAVAEEMADVLITLFIQADRMGIDIQEAYKGKMEYNLTKTGETDENGKVVDDGNIKKPNFHQFYD